MKHLSVFSILLFLLTGCDLFSSKPSEWSWSGSTMGTTFSIKTSALPSGISEQSLQKGITQTLDRVNQQMSTYLKDSELSKFNQSTSLDWQPVSADMAGVITLALDISEKTRGAYDITVGPLVNLWGFGPDAVPEEIPDESLLELARQKIGFHRLKVQDNTLKKEIPELYVDLSSIAKGYGVDQVAKYLDSQQIDAYMVEIGGEVRTKGKKWNGDFWRIAIEKPVIHEMHQIQTVLKVENMSIATSGDYRNYFEQDGKRYSHTIDPASGRPIQHSLASVTLLHEHCADADAWATALMVLGPEKGYDLAVTHHLAAFFLIKSGATFIERTTPEFEKYLQKMQND
ncbi:MAG: FAD:protein FMN transferase [SAR324 cluster bacterium]|nr:FAD:protein FMN transferase [SAR324 cluster bacterium]